MFPLLKDGHRFSFQEDGLHYVGPDSREVYFSFSEPLKVAHSPWTGKLKLKGPRGSVSLAFLSDSEQKALLLELFRRWRTRSPESAKKAAFDYVDGQKGFVALAFTVSLIFSLPLAVGLLADSREQFTCTRVLQENSAVGEMEVVKFKKKRKGHYILDLEFTAPDGTKFTGKDQLITQDETSIPKTVPVVYSPENPRCWSLTPNLEGTEVNWAKRRFFGFFTLLFGSFFLICSLWGVSWSLGRWFRPRPHKQDIAGLFNL